jgi:GntR family transcriptional regulator
MSEKSTRPHIPVHISMDDPEPLYAQIESQLRDFILSGVLKPGTRLPSVRALAADTTCSLVTTRRAYDDLEREGLIRTRQGVGSVVAAISEEQIMAHRREPAAAAFREGILLGRRAGLTEEELREIIEEALRSEETNVHRGGPT